MEIGTKIRKLRELQDYTQAYMAAALSISQSHYSRIESNQVDVSFSRLQQIAGLLNVELHELLQFDADRLLGSSQRENKEYLQSLEQQLSALRAELYRLEQELRGGGTNRLFGKWQQFMKLQPLHVT